MDRHELTKLLESYRVGTTSLDEVLNRLSHGSVAELGYAHVDLARSLRCGFPEVILCLGKTPEWIEGVMRRLSEAGQDCLATRVSPDQAEYLRPRFPGAEYNAIARTLWLARQNRPAPAGNVLVITAGTSDLPVAEEARVTASALGCE